MKAAVLAILIAGKRQRCLCLCSHSGRSPLGDRVEGISVDWHQRQPGHGMRMPVLCVYRFLQLELSEMEAFVNQHKSKVIKRQVIPFLFLLPYQGVYIFKIVCVHMQTGALAWGVWGTENDVRCHPYPLR